MRWKTVRDNYTSWNSHFSQKHLGSQLRLVKDVRKSLSDDLYNYDFKHDVHVYGAMLNMLPKKRRLQTHYSMYSNTKVRCAICDSLVSMLYDCHSYELKLEESISNNLEEKDDGSDLIVEEDLTKTEDDSPECTPDEDAPPECVPVSKPHESESSRPSIGGAVSQSRTIDYTVYTMTESGLSSPALTEAKRNITIHSNAQVIRCYISCFSISTPTPLVLMMAATEFLILIFSFYSRPEPLVNAVILFTKPV